MWWLIQSLIVFGVISSNIYYKLTSNGMLAAVIGGGLALLVTLIWNDVAEIRARKKRGTQR